ncbi:hypothetical protein FSST1_000312 [Fusarium sambucinum]
MAHELPEPGLAKENSSETNSPSKILAGQALAIERKNPNIKHHKDGTPYSQDQSNADQAPDEQPDRNESSSSLEQPSQQRGDRSSHVSETEDQSIRSATGSGISSNGSDIDFEPDIHWSEVVGSERLSPRIEAKFLELIKKKMLFKWGVGTEDVPNISIDSCGITTLRFKTDDATMNLAWDEQSRTEKDAKEVAKAQSSICQAWPRHRGIEAVKQFIVKSDGRDSPTWVSPSWADVDETYKDDFATSRLESIMYSGYEDTWHRWCFDAAEGYDTLNPRSPIRGKIVYCNPSGNSKGFEHFTLACFAISTSDSEPFSTADVEKNDLQLSLSYFSPNFRGGYVVTPWHLSGIHWKIRYFEPGSDQSQHETGINSFLLSERQTATIRQCLSEINVQEKRAQINFRFLLDNRNMFHILVMTDNTLYSSYPHSPGITQMYLDRYGLKLEKKTIHITQYLIEICRVFELSMEAWRKTLDSIDELVHVNLSDFDDRDRIEDLMFDKSFNRSRDYFVALQLLRIMDEWINEVVGSMLELKDDSSLKHPVFSSFQSTENLSAADRYMKERAGPVQRRIQKKTEEINSLRDGLFNATSLRESTKAMALNQAIYVFTVVTVLFTPVSFLATFWALPFLNNPREGSEIVPEPSAFRNSFIVMPLLTYALVLGIAWHVGSENPNVTLSRLIKATWRELREWPRSIWELRPRLPERKRTTPSNA